MWQHLECLSKTVIDSISEAVIETSDCQRKYSNVQLWLDFLFVCYCLLSAKWTIFILFFFLPWSDSIVQSAAQCFHKVVALVLEFTLPGSETFFFFFNQHISLTMTFISYLKYFEDFLSIFVYPMFITFYALFSLCLVFVHFMVIFCLEKVPLFRQIWLFRNRRRKRKLLAWSLEINVIYPSVCFIA